MKIVSAKIMQAELPLKVPFIVSYHHYTTMPTVILQLTTDCGTIGYGEATPDEHVTGETIGSVMTALEHYLLPVLSDFSPFDIEAIHEAMDKKMFGNPTAKAAIDLACYDLMGKLAKKPIYELLGGRQQQVLQVPVVISILSPEEMAQQAVEAKKQGFESIKLKLGTTPEADIERVKAVREAVGPSYSLKVDANQGWRDVQTALQAIRGIEPYHIDWVEQPTLADDIAALAEVRANTSIPIMADETVHSMKELKEVITKNAAQKVNIKLMKSAGLFKALQMTNVAEQAGLTCQIGSMVESSIASFAGLHLTTAKRVIESHELVGPWMIRGDVVAQSYHETSVTLNDTPGLGITVDEQLVQNVVSKSIIVSLN
ncbi:MAG: dipeptide epimerase [Solibacillus sp.]